MRRVNPSKKNPENSKRFRGANPHNIQYGFVRLPSSIQTILSAPELHRILPVFPTRKAMYLNRLVGSTTDREFTRYVMRVTLPRRLIKL